MLADFAFGVMLCGIFIDDLSRMGVDFGSSAAYCKLLVELRHILKIDSLVGCVAVVFSCSYAGSLFFVYWA